MEADIRKYFEFASAIGDLKKIERFKGHYFWRDYPQPDRYESVADHSWRLAMLVLMFNDRFIRKIDLGKALKLALVHDLPEVIAGDDSPVGEDGTGENTHAFNLEKKQARFIREKAAAETLFGKLPTEIGRQFLDLWLEYEDQNTFESRLVKSLDKIEATLQVLEYRKGHVFKEHLAFTMKYGTKGSQVDPAVEEFASYIIGEHLQQHREFKKEST